MLKNLTILAPFISISLFAEACCETYAPPRLEAKAGYFFFTSSTLSDVYSSGGFQVGVSGSYPVYKQLQVYGSAGFRELWGKSIHFNQNTSFWEIPIDVGLKPIFEINSRIDWYFTFGPRYFYFQQNNESNFVDQTVVKNGIGLFANTGFNFVPGEHFMIDLFAEYSYEPVSISAHQSEVSGRSTDVGGLLFGAGFGYCF